MNIDAFVFRKATIKDTGNIYKLYKLVAKNGADSVREESEISKQYVENFTLRALRNNTQFVVTDRSKENIVIGEIHCYKSEPKAYNHVLVDLTLHVHPEYKNAGVQKMLISEFLPIISGGRADILRVESTVIGSETELIKTFTEAGFITEGKFDKRIRMPGKQPEAEIAMAWFNPKYRRGE